MKKLVLAVVCGALTAGVLLMAGCHDWSSGGSSAWSSRYNWANFSGVYRAIDDPTGAASGPLVTNYTDRREQSGNRITEHFATGDGARTLFTGGLRSRQITPDTVTVTTPNLVMRDDGGGNLAGNGSTGTITYGNGFLTLNFENPPAAGVRINVSYQFDSPTHLSRSGVTGATIHSFSVEQTGERLVITDNNGAVYEGNMGRVASTSGAAGTVGGDEDEGVGEPITGTVIAQFQASGVSAAGVEVRMTGSFTADAAAGQLENRTIRGTWIEAGGKTGEINGATP